MDSPVVTEHLKARSVTAEVLTRYTAASCYSMHVLAKFLLSYLLGVYGKRRLVLLTNLWYYLYSMYYCEMLIYSCSV